MDRRDKLERRITEQQVADILACIAAPPGKRADPIEGDAKGAFDFWFDGGAARVQTGYIEYEFMNGSRATVGAPIPVLSVTVDFADGCRVQVQQVSWGPEAG